MRVISATPFGIFFEIYRNQTQAFVSYNPKRFSPSSCSDAKSATGMGAAAAAEGFLGEEDVHPLPHPW